MNRWTEFFEVNGSFAMRNLTVFITICVASVLLVILAFMRDNQGQTQLTSEIFACYMLAGGGVYGFAKWQDEKTKRFGIDSTPTPPAVTNVNNANMVTGATNDNSK